MIEKTVFGKGEAALIDRGAEIFPRRGGVLSQRPTGLPELPDAFMGEYFYILRKVFHTFAFDMKEFAIDFHEVSLDLFLRALTWLTYVQTIVYEMDIKVERETFDHGGQGLEREGRRIVEFLTAHDLCDSEIDRCVAEVVAYLQRELRDLRGKAEYSKTEILSILDLKSSDLELLRRLLLRLFQIPVDPDEMAIFKRIDRVREVFDDIRDYHEDLQIANFNTVIFLQKIGGDMRRGSALLRTFIEEEMSQIRTLVEALDHRRQRKLVAIMERLTEEKDYFLAQLDNLPRG